MGIDIAMPDDNTIQTNFGCQYQLHPAFAIRGGYDSSIDEGTGITAGFGISIQNFTLDAAYVSYGDLGDTYRVSLLTRFEGQKTEVRKEKEE